MTVVIRQEAYVPVYKTALSPESALVNKLNTFFEMS